MHNASLSIYSQQLRQCAHIIVQHILAIVLLVMFLVCSYKERGSGYVLQFSGTSMKSQVNHRTMHPIQICAISVG